MKWQQQPTLSARVGAAMGWRARYTTPSMIAFASEGFSLTPWHG